MSIRVEISARNLQVSDELDDYIRRKVEKLDRFMDALETASVDLNYAETARDANDRQVAQITVRGKGVLLRAEERTDDMFASVDAVSDKLLRQVDKFKGRHWKRRGDGKSLSELTSEGENEPEFDQEDQPPAIMRRKQFLLQPMDEQEALEQMELIGHQSFFVYLDADSGQVNVLYRRRNGTYGLIETELA